MNIVDPRRFLPADKVRSLRSSQGMGVDDISKAFYEMDSLLKDAPMPTEHHHETHKGEAGRVWQLMGVLGDDCEMYLVKFRQQRVDAAYRNLLLSPALESEPALAEFLARIGSVRVAPAAVETYGQYADDLMRRSTTRPEKSTEKGTPWSVSDDLAHALAEASGRLIRVFRFPEGPPDETAAGLYHKLALIGDIEKWARMRE